MRRYNIDAEGILDEIPHDAIIEYMIENKLIDSLLSEINSEDVFEQIVDSLDVEFILSHLKFKDIEEFYLNEK